MLLDFSRTLVRLIGYLMLVFSIIMIFEAHDYAMAAGTFAVFIVSLLISFILDKIDGKRAYNIQQKYYGIVVISDKCLDEDENNDPFEKEEDDFFDTGKVGFTSHYDLKQWTAALRILSAKAKDRIQDLRVVQDPTFMVITAYDSSKEEEAMLNPFLITSNPGEVIHFLQKYGR